MTSIRKVAFLWISVLLLLVGLGGAAAAYLTAIDETDVLLDQQLKQIARYVGDNPPPALPPPPDSDYDPEDDFLVQVWDASGTAMGTSDTRLTIPREPKRGFSTHEFGAEGWRTYTDISALRIVQISQRIAVRKELAANAALRTAVPIAILLPLSWLVLGFLVDRMIRRLDRITHSVTKRNENVRVPISLAGVPIEIAPLVEAVNDLVARLHNAVDRQRRFLSDAAHELRTPLTALSLQAGNIRGAIGRKEIDERVGDVEAGIRRASNVVNQLLKLARLDSGSRSDKPETIHLEAIVRECIVAIKPIADSKNIRLVGSYDKPARATATLSDIKTVIANILDNAVKYTPPGGRINVKVSDDNGRGLLTICDTGPGIPSHLIGRVFERFFRASGQEIEGAGLGLAICKSIADRNGMMIELRNRTDTRGLSASLRFPRADVQ